MKYAGAVLEICLRKVMFYPNIQTFIDEKLSNFPEVDVKYRYGAPPKLIMKDEQGNHKESIRYGFLYTLGLAVSDMYSCLVFVHVVGLCGFRTSMAPFHLSFQY